MEKFINILNKMTSFIKSNHIYIFDDKSLCGQPIGKKGLIISGAVILSVCVIIGLSTFSCGYHKAERNIFENGVNEYNEQPVTITINGVTVEEFSEEGLVDMLISLNIKYPDIVLAQAQIETGNYTSHIFHENNNLFGMKEARSRIHTHEGTQHGHAKYNNWQQSVLDYAFYQATYLSKIQNREQYIAYLDSSYAEIGGRYGDMIRKHLVSINEKYKF